MENHLFWHHSFIAITQSILRFTRVNIRVMHLIC